MIKHRTTAALGAAALAGVAVLGGTSYATSRPSHHRAATSHDALTTSDVKKLIKSYVNKHAQPIEFAAGIDATDGGGTIKTIGPWAISFHCDANGVSVGVSGPGAVAGTNTLGTVNGPAGASFETFGAPGGSNGASPGAQASQTLVLLNGNKGYTVTYMANADKSTPVNCDLLGYATPLSMQ